MRREENQLVTECFITLMICSTCFGHFYAHHQELEAISLLLPPMVCSAWLLVVGVRCRAAGCQSRKRDAAAEGGKGSVSGPDRSLPPGKTRYPLYRRLGGPQGRSGQARKISPLPEFDPRTVQPVASRYTDWAIPAQNAAIWCNKFRHCHSFTKSWWFWEMIRFLPEDGAVSAETWRKHLVNNTNIQLYTCIYLENWRYNCCTKMYGMETVTTSYFYCTCHMTATDTGDRPTN